MTDKTDFTFEAAFDVIAPQQQTLPFVFNSPHSGAHYPTAFLENSRLTPLSIRRSEDLFVDDLFMEMPKFGAPLLRANFPRAYLDVNREPYELDPKMFDGPLPSYANIRSIRVAGGLGTIARVVAEGQEIYQGKLSVDEALNRIEHLYNPYHKQLRQMLAKTIVDHDVAYLIDCHSMPSGHMGDSHMARPDFVLGDRYGTSCSTDLTDMIWTYLSNKGYHVSRNKPYAGGFITEHYGRPDKQLHAIQLEINRGLYADEENFERNETFGRVKKDLTSVFKKIFNHRHDLIDGDIPLAAE